jgi:hypothetical protein
MNSNRTAFQKELNFTTEKGIEIQKNQLNQLKCVLIPEAYTMLQSLATANNHLALDGFDVLRGVDMYNILSNEVVPFFLSKKSEE